MYEILLIYLALTGLFIILTYFVLKRSNAIPNRFFAMTTILFATSTFLSFVQEFYMSVLLIDDVLIFSVIGSFVFFLAPIGLLFCSITILYGYSSWKNKLLIMFILVYVIIQTILLMNHNGLKLHYIPDNWTNAVYILLVSVLLFLTVYFFSNIFQELSDGKTNMLFLMIGTSIGALGNVFNGFFVFTGDMNNIPSLIMILFGVLLASFSFIKFSVKSDLPSTEDISPNPT